MSNPYHWMPFFVAEYLADTTSLSTLEHGAYLLLIFAYWNEHGPLPDDDALLRRIAKCRASQWKCVRSTLLRYFAVEDGKWIHARIDKELDLARVRHEKRSQAGSAGGKAKAKQNSGNATTPPEQCPTTITIPITTDSNKDKGAVPPSETEPLIPLENEVVECGSMTCVPEDFCRYFFARHNEEHKWLTNSPQGPRLIEWRHRLKRWWEGSRATWQTRKAEAQAQGKTGAKWWGNINMGECR